MSGRIIEIARRTSYSLSLAASATQEISFPATFPPFKTLDWRSGFLKVVLQAKSFASSTASVSIKAHNAFADPDSPTTVYGTSTNPASVTIANADAAPLLYIAEFSLTGDEMTADMTFSQGANTGACTMTISVYLVGRDS